MTRLSLFLCISLCGLGAAVITPAAVWSAEEEPGLADLDKATELQLTAQSAEDLNKTIELVESALEKGLSEGNQQFAKQLLTSQLYRRASLLSAALFDQQLSDRQARRLWSRAIADVEKAVSHSEQFADGYLLLGQLHSIPGGDAAKAREAIDKAAELFKDDKEKLAETMLLRAQLQGDPEDMLKDINKALELFPHNTDALLMRARVHQAQGDAEKAKADLDEALKQQPELLEAVMLRIMFAEQEGRYADAIKDIKRLLRLDPENLQLRLQLALYYSAMEQPRSALEVVEEILKDDPENWIALRVRGDSRLSIGKHEEAIADYEKALQQQPEDTGILNNLAWTLATSPIDKLRDGERAIELAEKAAELTEFQEAHILSTLAAGYAETGNFEKALEWSQKAVDQSEGELKAALEKELESYKQKKPWRELKEEAAAAAEDSKAPAEKSEKAGDQEQDESKPAEQGDSETENASGDADEATDKTDE